MLYGTQELLYHADTVGDAEKPIHRHEEKLK